MSAMTVTVEPGGYSPLPGIANRLLAPLASTVRLEPDAIVEFACRATGLSDFGGEDFIEPLEVVTADLRAHPPSPLGRTLIRGTLTKALANRLRVVEASRTAPPDAASRAPLVIVGWHRSGTTFLHNLLDALPGFRYLPLYRLAEPVACVAERFKMWLALQGSWRIAPELRDIHRQSVTGPEEDWTLMMGALRVEGFVMHWDVPRYRRWLDDCDFAPAYRFLRRAVGVAAAQDGRRERVVLKDPAHLGALGAMHDAFPGARFIWTHRDPATMVASFASLSAIHHRTMYGVYDPVRAGRSSLNRCAHAVRRGLKDRPQIPSDRLVDVPYRRLKEDPIGTVLDICRQCDVEVSDYGLQALQRRLDELRAKHSRKHVYSLSKWGLDRATVEDRLRFYDPAHYR